MPKPKTLKERREVCAGGVVYRDGDGGFEVALAEECDRITGVDNIRLAKGHVEDGESPEEAAIREVREEIGVEARIVAPLGSVKYTFRDGKKRVKKEVHFYLMETASHEPLPLDGEMQRMYWCDIEKAMRQLTFDTEQRVLKRAKKHLRPQGGD